MAGQLNMLKLVEDNLASIIRTNLIKNLEERFVIEFKDRIRPMIQKEVDGLVIDRVEAIRSAMYMRDEVHTYVHWDDKEKK